MLIDLHAHLTMPHFTRDRQDVVRRATETGVPFKVTGGTDLGSSREAVALSHEHKSVYAVAGIHPHADALTSFGPESLQ